VKEPFGEWTIEVTGESSFLFHIKTEEYILHLATVFVSVLRDK